MNAKKVLSDTNNLFTSSEMITFVSVKTYYERSKRKKRGTNTYTYNRTR